MCEWMWWALWKFHGNILTGWLALLCCRHWVEEHERRRGVEDTGSPMPCHSSCKRPSKVTEQATRWVTCEQKFHKLIMTADYDDVLNGWTCTCSMMRYRLRCRQWHNSRLPTMMTVILMMVEWWQDDRQSSYGSGCRNFLEWADSLVLRLAILPTVAEELHKCDPVLAEKLKANENIDTY